MRYLLLSLITLSAANLFAQWNTSGTHIYSSNSGNVGIGTSSPQAKLDVNGQIAVNGTPVITQGGSDVYANIRVLRNTSPSNTDGMYIGYGGSGGPLHFFSNSGTTEFMTLSTSGKLGVGTVNPQTLLNIAQGAGDPAVGTAALREQAIIQALSLESKAPMTE